ncbi:hypothetical protein FKP32DRAFT_1677849 [Trametes sanguinea]|nr:hypothetical protein FKP32DRAFT_1677849 [Trametes sanguinea]
MPPSVQLHSSQHSDPSAQSATALSTQSSPGSTSASPHNQTYPQHAPPHLEPALGLVLISAVGAAFLVSALCLLCMSRRRPQWRLLRLCGPLVIALGLAHASLDIYVQTQSLARSNLGLGTIVLNIVALSFAVPILGASLVLLKICSLCSHIVPWRLRVPMYGPSVAFKIFRIAFVTLCMLDVPRRPELWRVTEELPRAKIVAASCLQLGDDLCTLILMVVPRLRTQTARHDADSDTSSGASVSSHSRRRAISLSQAAAGTFFILLSLDIVQLVLTCHPPAVGHSYAGAYLFTVNVYVQAICAILVVVWYHPSHLTQGRWCRGSHTPTAPGADSAPMAARFISPLPQHPALPDLLADSGFGQGSGSGRSVNTEDSGESDTIGPDKRSTLHSTADDAAVVKTSTAPSAFPKTSEFEPSTVSYSGSVLLDDFGKPVFYAM